MSKGDNSLRLRAAMRLIVRAFLVTGRAGSPAEGRIPFNPLYFNILVFIRENGSTAPMALASVLGVARTTLSTASKALETRGLVAKHPNAQDKRSHNLVLTEEGEQVADAILRQDLRNADAILNALDKADADTFVQLLEQAANKLSKADR